MSINANFHSSIEEIDANAWDALWPNQYPFTRHAFFQALETSGSIDNSESHGSGWQGKFLALYDNDSLVAGMPLFIKTHSYGEYVFDWSWANAFHQAGIAYYPKIINAIPFTPATGPRIGVAAKSESEQQSLRDLTVKYASEFALQHGSGFHALYPLKEEAQSFTNHGMQVRHSYQFQWFNQNYRDFDDFLDHFSSRKRKNVKKERRKVSESGLHIQMRRGDQVSDEDWKTFYALYHRTYIKRSGQAGYLNSGFFQSLARQMPEQVLLASAHDGDSMVAAASYFRDEYVLYGRYWGTKLDIDGLHFECCYYQGIEYAIREKLIRFDPGVQGEHKILRGFTPIKTQSFHLLKHPAFNRAIEEFTASESRQIGLYLEDARSALPFKEGTSLESVDYLIGS